MGNQSEQRVRVLKSFSRGVSHATPLLGRYQIEKFVWHNRRWSLERFLGRIGILADFAGANDIITSITEVKTPWPVTSQRDSSSHFPRLRADNEEEDNAKRLGCSSSVPFALCAQKNTKTKERQALNDNQSFIYLIFYTRLLILHIKSWFSCLVKG